MTDPVAGTIFTKEGTPAPAGTPTDPAGERAPLQVQPDLTQVFGDTLAQIKNENGEQKYKDVFTALSALKHTQEHVKTLEDENNKYRSEGIKAQTMDEVLQQIEATKQTKQEPTSSVELNVDQQREMTFNTIKEYEAQKAATANKAAVSDALLGKFKDQGKAIEAFNSKAQELGLTPAVLENLAATSPKAVLEYFADSKGNSFKPTEGTVNTAAMQSANPAQPAKKNIMHGASTADIMAAWRSAGQSVSQEFSN
jgi:hypothetical protein